MTVYQKTARQEDDDADKTIENTDKAMDLMVVQHV